MTEDPDTAARVAESLLAELRVAYPAGVPNLYRTLLGNPAVLSGFVALDLKLEAHGRLSPAERLLVGLVTAREVDCAYCRAALSTEARAAGAADAIIDAILHSAQPEDARAGALAGATARVLELHGRLPRAEIAHFARQGLEEADLLEVIAVVGLFTIATYSNNLMRTRIDPEYRPADA